MTTPFLCVLAAFVIAWLARVPIYVAIRRAGEGIDSKEPARQLATLEGLGARALAAHRGLLASFPGFAAAVLTAHLAEAEPRRIAVLSVAFVVAQVVYVVAYLGNADYLRIFVWLIGMLTTLAIFGLGF